MALRVKIFLFAITLIVIVIGTSFYFLNRSFSNSISLEIRNHLEETETIFNKLIDDRKSLLELIAKNIADVPKFFALVDTRDQATILNQLPLYAETNKVVDIFVVSDTASNVITYYIPSDSDNSSDPVIISEVEQYLSNVSEFQDIWIIKGKLYQISIQPVTKGEGGIFLGGLILGRALDNDFADELNGITETDITFVQNDSVRGASKLPSDNRSDIINFIKEARENPAKFTLEDELSGFSKFKIADNDQIGSVGSLEGQANVSYILTRPLAEEVQILTTLRTILIILGGGAFVLSFILSFFFSTRLTKPLNSLVGASKAIAGGDYDVSVMHPQAHNEETKDEISLLAHSFSVMRDTVKNNIKEITGLNSELSGKNKALERALEDLKKAQDELINAERLSTVGKMASAIVHDFKGPMQVIKGMTQIMQMPNVDEEKKNDMMKHIDQAVNRMNQMTMEILDFVRGESNLVLEKVKLSKVVNEIIVFMAEELRSHEFKVNRTVDFDPELEIDVLKIKRVIENIIRNAIEASKEGNTLDISTLKDNGKVQISIRDNGPGIPAEIRDKVFEPFVTKGKSQGTGLGLAIVKKVVEDHKGLVDLESEVGKGTTFRIKLPYIEN